MFEVKSYKS